MEKRQQIKEKEKNRQYLVKNLHKKRPLHCADGLLTLCFFESSAFAERRIENFLADAQALGSDFQKLVRIDEIERLLKA